MPRTIATSVQRSVGRERAGSGRGADREMAPWGEKRMPGALKAMTVALQVYAFYYACISAYTIRLHAVNEYGRIIHEFDPWWPPPPRASVISVLFPGPDATCRARRARSHRGSLSQIDLSNASLNRPQTPQDPSPTPARRNIGYPTVHRLLVASTFSSSQLKSFFFSPFSLLLLCRFN